MPTNYERGRAAEYHVKRLLEEQGYRYVIRSAASHTPIDLLCSNGSEIRAVQVKAGGYLSSRDKGELVIWAKVFNAKPVLARKSRGRWDWKEI